MSTHSEICPVCQGSGRYRKVIDPNGMGYKNTSIGLCSYETTCHGCNGKGWVVVDNNEVEYGRVTYGGFNMQDAINQHIPHID